MEWGAVQYPGVTMPVGDSSEWVEPAYYEAWQNQSTTLMPEYNPRDYFGMYSLGETGGSWFILQLSTPIFDPDGTAAPEPITFEMVNNGETTFEIK